MPFDRKALDLRSIGNSIADAKPDIIVNAAAYTAVDRAERERDAAFEVNARAVAEIAQQARSVDALLVHFSTDYVFDGRKPAPYVETDAPRPLSVYGKSKLEGERALEASGCRHLVFRCSWIYAPAGRNFVNAILAAAKAGRELRVVDDQRGAPTSSTAVAAAVTGILSDAALRGKPSGIYHMSAAGETTWHGFAKEILAGAQLDARLTPVSSADYGAAAPRPQNSMLDNAKLRSAFGVSLPDWREGFRAAMRAMH